MEDIKDWLTSQGSVAKYILHIFKAYFFNVGRSYTCMENCEYAALTLLALFSHSCDFLCELHCICQFYISSAVVLPILFSFILLQDNFAKQAT